MIWKEDRKRQFDMIFLIIDRVFGIEGCVCVCVCDIYDIMEKGMLPFLFTTQAPFS